MRPLFGDAWRGRRVLVTGHTGFKGSWLAAWLVDLGAEVAGYALDVPTKPSNFEVLGLKTRMSHHQGDLADLNRLRGVMTAFKPEAVLHLAAQALVRRSYEEPAVTFATNAMGTLNVLEAIRATPSVRAAVLITSDKCYRNDEWVWGYRETDALGGDDPYSASKACAEIIARSYMRSFFRTGPAMATVRAGNVVGGGDWAKDRIVPDCARAWADRRPAPIRSPLATRPWQHVLEPLSGYLWLGAKLLAGENGLNHEPFNFGPAAQANHTVAEVAAALAGHWPGFETAVAEADRDAGKESTLLKLCCDKALALLDWRATLDFAATMAFTAAWYKAYYASPSEDMYAFTRGQIARYAALAAQGGLAWAL